MLKFINQTPEYAETCSRWLAKELKLVYGKDYTWHSETRMKERGPDSYDVETDIVFVFKNPAHETFIKLKSL